MLVYSLCLMYLLCAVPSRPVNNRYGPNWTPIYRLRNGGLLEMLLAPQPRPRFHYAPQLHGALRGISWMCPFLPYLAVIVWWWAKNRLMHAPLRQSYSFPMGTGGLLLRLPWHRQAPEFTVPGFPMSVMAPCFASRQATDSVPRIGRMTGVRCSSND
jgi:hypothetical protein